MHLQGGTPVASLPMYDWAEVRWATDALWAAIADRLNAAGIAAPDALTRSCPLDEVWTNPALLLSQTCAWPYITRLRGHVSLVATPVYDVDGCAGGLYSSFLVTRADEPGASLAAFRGRRFAINHRESLSGFVALRRAMTAEGLGEEDVGWLETGGHRDSMRAVAEGRADLAAIDAICWALAGRHETAAARLKTVGRTPLRPGLPFVSSASADPNTVRVIREALVEAVRDPQTRSAREALFLAGIEVIPEADYVALAQLAH